MVRVATVVVASAVLLQHASCFQISPASAFASSSSVNSARCQISRRQGSAALSMGLFDGLWGQQQTSEDDAWKNEQMRIQQEMLAKRQQAKQQGGAGMTQAEIQEMNARRMQISQEADIKANQYKDFQGDPLELWKQQQEAEAAASGRDVSQPFGYDQEPEKGSGFSLPIPANPMGNPTFDAGERFDLKLPYADRGYEDQSADVMGNLFGGLFGGGKKKEQAYVPQQVSGAQFNIGQEIPYQWQEGVQWARDGMSYFEVGETVVITRSDGSQKFGVVKGSPAPGSYDVVVEQTGSYQSSISSAAIGKIAPDVANAPPPPIPAPGAPPPKAVVPASVMGGVPPPPGMPPPPPGAPPRAVVPQGVMPPPGVPPPPGPPPPQARVPPKQALPPPPPQQAPSQEPGADWGEYVPPPRVEKIPVMVGNSMVQLRGMPAAPPTQAGMNAVPQLTPANLQSNLEWGLLVDTVCPPAWVETKQYKREGKLEPGALVMVSRSDGTTRFGQVRKKTGLLWQDLWEVIVSLKPDGSALATRVEEGVMLGRPFPDAVAAHKTALAPQMQMEAPASGDDQWV